MGKKVSKNSCVWDNPNTWRVGPKFWKVSGVPRFVFGMAHVKRTLTQARFAEASADRKPAEVESVLALGNEMEGPRRTNARTEWDNGSEREGPNSGRSRRPATKCDVAQDNRENSKVTLSSSAEHGLQTETFTGRSHDHRDRIQQPKPPEHEQMEIHTTLPTRPTHQ